MRIRQLTSLILALLLAFPFFVSAEDVQTAEDLPAVTDGGASSVCAEDDVQEGNGTDRAAASNGENGGTETEQTEAPTEKNETETPAEQTETETPAEQTETEAPDGQTETEIPAEQTETETPAEQTETETPAEQTETETPDGQTEKGGESGTQTPQNEPGEPSDGPDADSGASGEAGTGSDPADEGETDGEALPSGTEEPPRDEAGTDETDAEGEPVPEEGDEAPGEGDVVSYSVTWSVTQGDYVLRSDVRWDSAGLRYVASPYVAGTPASVRVTVANEGGASVTAQVGYSGIGRAEWERAASAIDPGHSAVLSGTIRLGTDDVSDLTEGEPLSLGSVLLTVSAA